MVIKKFSSGFTQSPENSIAPKRARSAMLFFGAGFTLVEMLVCITIIGFLATVLLGSRDKYGEQLILRNQAYKLLTYIRQAQVYSLGVKASGGNFNVSYGVSIGNLDNEKNRFYFFTDSNSNGIYDDATVETVIYGSGIVVKKICATLSSGTAYAVCNPNGAGAYNSSHPARLEVTFLRPSSSARTRILNNTNSDASPALYPPVRIELQNSAGNLSSFVFIDSNGRVSIQ